MALRDERQIIDPENAIPSRRPDAAISRLEREIRNGAIRDRIDLTVALGSWEYQLIPADTREQLLARFPETAE